MGQGEDHPHSTPAEGLLPAPSVRITLFVASGSHACEEARSTLSDITRGLDPALVQFSVCDVATDPALAEEHGIVWTPTLIVQPRAKPRVTMVGSLGDPRTTLFRLNRAGVPLIRGVDPGLLRVAANKLPIA
jgi:KaiB-like protein